MKMMICFLIGMLVSTAAIASNNFTSKAVGIPIVLDTSSTNVTSAAWVELQAAASRLYACSAIQIHNTGSQPIKLGTGAAAAEVDAGHIFPVGVSILVPAHLLKGVRLAVRSMGATQSSGLLTLACFQ